MAKRPIAGKITVAEGITTVDLHVGAQTVRLTIEQAHEVARELDMVATTLTSKIRAAKKKPKGATPTPPRDSTRGHDVAGRRAGLDQLPPMWRPTPRGRINGADLRTTGRVAQTYESWAQEIEGAITARLAREAKAEAAMGNVRLLGLGHRSARVTISSGNATPAPPGGALVAAYDPEDARRIARLGRTYNKATYRRRRAKPWRCGTSGSRPSSRACRRTWSQCRSGAAFLGRAPDTATAEDIRRFTGPPD